jgi:hypothetical protein
MLASGSDDGSVKLWSINQAKFHFCTWWMSALKTKRTAVIMHFVYILMLDV